MAAAMIWKIKLYSQYPGDLDCKEVPAFGDKAAASKTAGGHLLSEIQECIKVGTTRPGSCPRRALISRSDGLEEFILVAEADGSVKEETI